MFSEIKTRHELSGSQYGRSLCCSGGTGKAEAAKLLYPALHKLEQQGWIKAEWRVSETNRRAKYYSLTRAGRRALADEAENWERLSAAISALVRAV